MALKVIQWATGSVGRASLECILEHPDLELAGCYVHSGEKSGQDVGQILGTGPVGVTTTNDTGEILRLEADAIMYAPLIPSGREVSAILRSGKNVVTPVGWFYPEQRDRDRLNQACAEGGVSIHATGIDPGGVTEVFPLVLSAMSSGVTFIRGEEISDIRTYGSADVVREVMLFGAPPEKARQGAMMSLLDSGYTQSTYLMTDALGIDRDQLRVERVLQTAVATAPIDSPIGVISPGEVAGQRFFWDGYVGDHHVSRVGVTWLMGEENLDPPWNFGEEGERFEMEVQGDPSTRVSITSWHPGTIEEGLRRNPGLVATAAHCVNAIPAVVAAAPGLHTSLDLPMITGRIHSKITRVPRLPDTR
jgi:hypothetical protein